MHDLGLHDEGREPAPLTSRSLVKDLNGSSHVAVDCLGVDELQHTFAACPPDVIHDLEILPKRQSRSSASTVEGELNCEKRLKDVVKRCYEASIKWRELGVVFNDLRVVGIGARTLQPTMGSLFSPFSLLRSISAIRNPPVRDILSGFEGVVAPGEMLLVLGKPGSGCSTFLKTLANQRGEYHAVEGQVSYDSFTPEDIRKHYRGDVIYCPEDDIHFPTLTVEQTISFAIKTRTPHTRLANQSRKQFNEEMLDALLRIFGLRHARKDFVGNATIRGVSGGEKKRVSIAEALSCRSVLGAWDNSTRGLDSSTALEFVQALRLGTDIARLTTIVSIYQAGEQLYDLFDKVCVIAEGKMAYFGPAKAARQYFIDMGYEPHNRQTTADFLVAVTDPIGRRIRPGFEGTVPRTAEQMAAHFKASELGYLNRQAIEEYRALHVSIPDRKASYRQSASMEHSRHAPKSNSYTISIPMQIRAVVLRRMQIIKGDFTAQGVQLFAQTCQAIIIGTVFFKLPDTTSGYPRRGALLFIALLFDAIFCMTEIPTLFAQRPIVLRHHKAAMYYPFIEALAYTVVDIPITFAIQAIYCFTVYFLVGLERTASNFVIFFMIVFTMTVVMKALFRLIVACFEDESSATSLAGMVTLFIALYSGYVIPPSSILGGLKWTTYLNPLHYAFGAILINEFHTLNGTCSMLVPQGPGYENVSSANQVCTTVGSLPGMTTVDGNRFANLLYGYSYSNLWRNYGIICAFGVGSFVLLLIATEYNTSSTFNSAVTLFKQGTRSTEVIVSAADEEKPCLPGTATHDAGRTRTADNVTLGKPATIGIFTWQHIQYIVPVSGGERRLLDDVSGYIIPGQLTALMGESGAGKTSLLNVLAQRIDIGVVGERFVNGQPLPADFQAQIGYCQQTDTHLSQSTVWEALLFSARLRQPESVPAAELEAHVDKCLIMCGLESYADAIVGSLDVEHRKRTTIGVELAAKPKLLLFLDEPTSGLDSLSAWAIMMCLRELANNGQAILCTIHQPSAELFQVFDRLLLLRKGGQTVYFGDIGNKSSIMLNYFERNGGPHCGDDANPAEYVLDTIGAGATATTSIDWYDVWLKSPEAVALQERIAQIHADGRMQPAIETERRTKFATSWIHQAITLTKRNFQAYWRNTTYLMAKMILNVACGLLIGITFFQTKDTLQGMQNRLIGMFMTTILCVPLSQQIQSICIDIRTIYEVRERPSRIYTWTALVTSQLLVEIPWNIFCSSLFFVSWYWTASYFTDRAGYTYLMCSIVFPLFYTTMAQAIASTAPTGEIASVIFGTLFSFIILVNGVFQPFRTLGWWVWMYRVSPFTYLEEGLLGQAISGQLVNCASDELVSINPPSGLTCSAYMDPFMSMAGGYVTNGNATTECLHCPYRTADQFMMDLNMRHSHDWRNLGILMGFSVFNVFAIYLLTYIFRVRGGSIFKRRG